LLNKITKSAYKHLKHTTRYCGYTLLHVAAACRHFDKELCVCDGGLKGKIMNLFLSDSQKLEQRAKKFIEIRGENVE
jgi:hypothetical protein